MNQENQTQSQAPADQAAPQPSPEPAPEQPDQQPPPPEEPALPVADFDWHYPLGYLEVAWAAFKGPKAFFLGMAQYRDYAPPLVFLFITHLVPALVGAFWMVGTKGELSWPVWIMSLVSSLAQSLVMALLIFGITRTIMKSDLNLPQTLRIYAYGGAIWVVSFVSLFVPPGAAMVLMAAFVAVHFYLMMKGLMALGRLNLPVAVAVLIAAMVTLFLILTGLSKVTGAFTTPPPT